MDKQIPPIFKKDFIKHIFLGILNPQGPFPDKIYAHSISISDPPVLYIPRIYADAIITMDKEDNAIGHCECSNCQVAINPFDIYCSNCGAKIKRRQIIGEEQ